MRYLCEYDTQISAVAAQLFYHFLPESKKHTLNSNMNLFLVFYGALKIKTHFLWVNHITDINFNIWLITFES